MHIERIRDPITLDGRVDEPIWEEVAMLPLIQYGPYYHGEFAERSELRVAYDDRYIYFSCRCYDSDPSGIRVTSLKRDAWNSSFDQIGLLLDTFNDKENHLAFIISAAGVRTDAALSKDGDGIQMSWDTFWDAKTHQSESGWSAEGRIPLSSLKFNTVDGKVVMGLSFYRFIARTRETHLFPDIPPNWGQYSWTKPSRAQEVEFTGIQSKNSLYITPYVLTGLGQRFELNEKESAYDRVDDPTYDIGLDLKYGLTNNLTLDLTVNTDFAQVEADDQQVNLTRFSLFFPEKRRFFQERTSNFDFEFGGSDRLFYSRKIGLADGRKIPLLGGARVVGRIGKWDIGFLNMQAARDSNQPSENFGVLRLRRQVANPSSYVGGMITSRLDEDGGYNLAYGGDAILRVSEDDYVTLNWAQTFEEGAGSALDIARVRARWYKNRQQGLTYDVGLARSGKDYNPGIGFQRRKNFSSVSNKLEYGWVPSDASPLRQHELSFESDLFLRNEDRRTDTWKTSAGWNFLLKNGASGGFSVTRTYEDLVDSFSISDDITIDTGRYTNYAAVLRYEMSSSKRLRTAVRASAGSYFEGSQISARMSPTWTLSRFFELSGSYQYDRIDFSDSKETFTSHLGRLRAQLTLNAFFSITGFVQISSSAHVAIANFRLRFNPREGNDFYLVYNEGFNIDRPLENPRLPISDGRTILLKYSYTFLR